MIGALFVAVFSVAGGLLIRDAKAFLVFTALTATAAFLLAFLVDVNAPLGLLGLTVPAFGVLRRLRMARLHMARPVAPPARQGPRTYRSSRRLERLDEVAVTIPEQIMDVVPAGSVRRIHPKVVELAYIAIEASGKGYSTEEPSWFSMVRRYLDWVGPELKADRTKVISEFEIIEI